MFSKKVVHGGLNRYPGFRFAHFSLTNSVNMLKTKYIGSFITKIHNLQQDDTQTSYPRVFVYEFIDSVLPGFI